MGPATGRLFVARAEDGVTHDGNATPARHDANPIVGWTTYGDVFVEGARMSARRIAAVAATVAVDRAAHHAGRRRPRVVAIGGEP